MIGWLINYFSYFVGYVCRLVGRKLNEGRSVCLQSNRLTKIENLHSLTLLDELYLSENGCTEIEGLDKNTEISTLDLANNKIRSIDNLQHLSKLEELWVRKPFVDI